MLRSESLPGTRRTLSGLIGWIFLMVTLLIPYSNVEAKAAGQVQMAVQPGINGLYKMGFPTGLQVTLVNHGQEMTGLLVMQPVRGQEGQVPPQQDTRYQKSIQVPASGMVTTSFIVPSEIVNQGAKLVLLVDGQPITDSAIQGTAVSGGFIALSLGEKQLRGGLAAWLDQSFGGQTAIKYVPPAYLPKDPLELVMADLILVDEGVVKQLKEPQIELLKDWVSLGGTLVLSGGAGSVPGGPLAAISPVESTGQKMVATDLGGLQGTQETMTVQTGPLKEGDVLAQAQDVILVAARNVGKGRVIYSAIPLENVNSEAARLWPLMFNREDGAERFDVKMQMAMEKRQMGNDQLGQAASYLPQLKTPPVPQVAVAWVIYALVVGPGLYFLLKRYDRRDWMWWLIPACAVVTTGAVYLMSPAQRIHVPFSQTLSVVEIMDDKRAEINATAAFVTPYGGTLQVKGSQEAVLWPSNFYFTGGQKSPVIHYAEKSQPHITFPNVEYWSMRQARANVLRRDMGSIGGELVLENGYIKGTVVNHTQMDLSNCQVLLGGRTLGLGDIPAGQSVQINQALDKWPNSLGPNEFRDLLLPPSKPGETDPYVRERQMVDVVLGPRMNTYSNQPIFFGWSVEDLALFKIVSDGQDTKDFHLNMVTQEIPFNIATGAMIELPPGLYIPKMIESRGAFNQTPMGYTLYEGKLTLGIDLDKPLGKEDFQVVALDFAKRSNENMVVQLYDWQEKKWVEVPTNGLKLGAQELKPYRSPAGELRFQYEKIAGLGQPERIDLPAIAVEGVKNR